MVDDTPLWGGFYPPSLFTVVRKLYSFIKDSIRLPQQGVKEISLGSKTASNTRTLAASALNISEGMAGMSLWCVQRQNPYSTHESKPSRIKVQFWRSWQQVTSTNQLPKTRQVSLWREFVRIMSGGDRAGISDEELSFSPSTHHLLYLHTHLYKQDLRNAVRISLDPPLYQSCQGNRIQRSTLTWNTDQLTHLPARQISKSISRGWVKGNKRTFIYFKINHLLQQAGQLSNIRVHWQGNKKDQASHVLG